MKNSIYLISALLLILGLSLTACNEGSAERLPAEGSNNSVAQAADAPAEAEKAPAQVSAGDPATGQTLFISTCSACHGPAGEGVPGLGKDMTTSEFIGGKTDTDLISFIKAGRDPSDPLNTTGVAMPPKGGNPVLNDEDLQHIVAYIRSIHK